MDVFRFDVDPIPPELMVNLKRHMDPWSPLSGIGYRGGIGTNNWSFSSQYYGGTTQFH